MPVSRGPAAAARKAELEQRVHQHLTAYPSARLSPYEIARALGLGPSGKTGVISALHRLQGAGHVVSIPSPNPNGTTPVTRWQASTPGADQ